MMLISSPLLLFWFIIYFLTMLLAIFLVVKEERYEGWVKIFLGLVFMFVPFSGIIYLVINYKKIPAVVN